MTISTQPANWSIRRFPQKGAWAFLLILWVASFLVFVGTKLVVEPFANTPWWESKSVWERAFQPMWAIAFIIGLSLIGFYLRLHVAHGQTRRRFTRQATVYLVVSTAALAALTTLGFVLEAAVFRIKNWQFLTDLQYMIGAAIDFPVVYARLWLEFGTWMLAGMLVTAGFRRFKVIGLLLTVPLALMMIALAFDTTGSSDFFGMALRGYLGPISAASILLSLAASWALARKIAV